jgi:D-sedoheptulose 7-phosphate isomerase
MFNAYLDSASACIQTLRDLQPEFRKAVSVLAECLSSGGKILACGNGGSAAESAHFATELLCRFEKDRPSLAALNLTADGSFLTATGNDYEFISIFARQIDGLARKGDVLVVFTTSGNSKNILEALRSARTRGMRTIALLGRDGGAAKELSEIALIVPSQITSHIQEAHQVLLHCLCAEVEVIMFPSLRK